MKRCTRSLLVFLLLAAFLCPLCTLSATAATDCPLNSDVDVLLFGSKTVVYTYKPAQDGVFEIRADAPLQWFGKLIALLFPSDPVVTVTDGAKYRYTADDHYNSMTSAARRFDSYLYLEKGKTYTFTFSGKNRLLNAYAFRLTALGFPQEIEVYAPSKRLYRTTDKEVRYLTDEQSYTIDLDLSDLKVNLAFPSGTLSLGGVDFLKNCDGSCHYIPSRFELGENDVYLHIFDDYYSEFEVRLIA